LAFKWRCGGFKELEIHTRGARDEVDEDGAAGPELKTRVGPCSKVSK